MLRPVNLPLLPPSLHKPSQFALAYGGLKFRVVVRHCVFLRRFLCRVSLCLARGKPVLPESSFDNFLFHHLLDLVLSRGAGDEFGVESGLIV